MGGEVGGGGGFLFNVGFEIWGEGYYFVGTYIVYLKFYL